MAERPIVSSMPDAPNDAAPNTATAMVLGASPVPSTDEVVAIMAAVEALWPRAVAAPDSATPRNRSWRFSGRWWSLPLPMRRDRPFR